MSVSEPYIVWDTLKYDTGIDGTATDSIWSTVTYFTRGTEYTTFTNTENTISYITINNNTAFEMDFKTDMTGNNTLWSVRQGSSPLADFLVNGYNLETNTWYHFKCEIANNMCTFTCNGVTSTPVDVTNLARAYLRVAGNKQVLFKNLVVYNI